MSKFDFDTHWFNRVWTEGDPAAVDEMIAPDAVIGGIGNSENFGPEALKVSQRSLLARIENVKFTILRVIEDGDWAAILWSMAATSKLTGSPVASTGTIFAEIRNGQFIGGYNHFDSFGLYQDMGLLPKDMIPRLFEGKSLV